MVKILRSLIHELIPLDLRFKIELLSRRRDIVNKEKQDELIELLRSFKLDDFIQLGPGTNRIAFKLKGFVVKIATDNDGKIDNLKEFKMALRLFPYVTKTYEVSENGTLLIAEYIQPFISYGEMQAHADQIREILDKLSKVYLLGDVGITSKNFANWGMRIGTDIPVCLDFAYVYDVSSNLFICNKCGTNSMLLPDRNYIKLICSNPGCRAEFSFEDIRRKISNEAHMNEIGDLKTEAYLLTESNVKTELDPERSRYLMKKYKQNKKSVEKEVVDEVTPDTFVMEHEPAFYINKQKMEENDNMDGNLVVEARLYGEEYSKPKTPRTVVSARAIVKNTNEKKEKITYNKDDHIEVIAKPVQNNTELAFKCEMDPNDSIDNIMKIPSIQSINIDNEEENVNETSEFVPQFVNNMHKAISKLSNKIASNLYDKELYEVVRKDLTSTDNFFAGDFYKIVQNAIFRSLTIFLNMEETDITNQKTGKSFTIYKAPVDINNKKYYATLKFIERFWLNRDINELDHVEDIMSAYKKLYDDYQGLDSNWLPTFTARLSSNLTIADKFTIATIVRYVENDWCDDSHKTLNDEHDNDLEEAPSWLNDFRKIPESIHDSDIKIFNDENKEETEDHHIYEAEIVEKWDEEESEESKEENDDSSLISVEIYPNEKLDLVKVKYFDEVQTTISVDCKLSDYDNKNLGSAIRHPLAGVWNWLSYIEPDFVFSTTDPEYWLTKNNQSDDSLRFYKYAVITTVDTSYIMGLYCIEGIYINEHDDVLDLTTDPTILKRLNNLLTSSLSAKMVHLEDHILEKYEIHTEEELRQFNGEHADEIIESNDESEDDFEEETFTDVPEDNNYPETFLTPIRRIK